ncbi:MAG TPA: DUF3299 domain-containing protein [Turneriella sp.]|nr:DUF3299 domain-containing protein [Turneriella sp.]
MFIFLAVGFTPVLQSESAVNDISWKTLKGYNLKSKKMTTAVSRLNGQMVRIPGFMVPLDDMGYATAGRFLLVPDPQSCIHAPAPPANQMIYVVMENNKQAPVRYGIPVLLTGKLTIKSIRSQFGVVTFQLLGKTVEQFRGRR